MASIVLTKAQRAAIEQAKAEGRRRVRMEEQAGTQHVAEG